jgi:hypothetical protein
MDLHGGRLVFSVTRYLTLLKSNLIPDSDRIEDGDLVVIDNRGGTFNIRPVNARPIH